MSKSSVSGTMNAQVTDSVSSGGGTIASYRIVARINTNAPTSGSTLRFTGKVEALTP